MEDQLNESTISELFSTPQLQMKLVCKYIEFNLISNNQFDFDSLEKIVTQRENIAKVFIVLQLRSEMFAKHLDSLDIDTSVKSRKFHSQVILLFCNTQINKPNWNYFL